MKLNVRLSALPLFILCLLLAAPALAAKNDLSSPLGEIEWGDGKKEVVKKVKKQMLSKLRERDELRRDRVLMQRERKRIVDDVARLEKSYEKLGANSDYRVSVISDEFRKDGGQAMMTIKDRVANRYYFFNDGKLYKMVVAYNQSYLKDVDFETFVVQTAKKYGKPDDTEYGDIGDEEALVKAIWKDGKTILRVDNKREFFGTFTMAFVDQRTVERNKKLAQVERDDGDSDKVSKRVESLTDISKTDADNDVVDSIVGDSEIDLNEGRPVDEQVRHGEQQKEAVAAKESAAKKSKAKKKKKKRRKKKKKKRDFSDIEASSGGGDDLIIY